jgi:hypothetical protein
MAMRLRAAGGCGAGDGARGGARPWLHEGRDPCAPVDPGPTEHVVGERRRRVGWQHGAELVRLLDARPGRGWRHRRRVLRVPRPRAGPELRLRRGDGGVRAGCWMRPDPELRLRLQLRARVHQDVLPSARQGSGARPLPAYDGVRMRRLFRGVFLAGRRTVHAGDGHWWCGRRRRTRRRGWFWRWQRSTPQLRVPLDRCGSGYRLHGLWRSRGFDGRGMRRRVQRVPRRHGVRRDFQLPGPSARVHRRNVHQRLPRPARPRTRHVQRLRDLRLRPVVSHAVQRRRSVPLRA